MLSRDSRGRCRIQEGSLSRPRTSRAQRLVTKTEAAEYCGLSHRGFGNWIAKGLIPPALPGTNRWDLNALDHHLDRLSGLTAETVEDDPFTQWLTERDASSS